MPCHAIPSYPSLQTARQGSSRGSQSTEGSLEEPTPCWIIPRNQEHATDAHFPNLRSRRSQLGAPSDISREKNSSVNAKVKFAYSLCCSKEPGRHPGGTVASLGHGNTNSLCQQGSGTCSGGTRHLPGQVGKGEQPQAVHGCSWHAATR